MRAKEFLNKKESEKPNLILFHNVAEKDLSNFIFNLKWNGLPSPSIYIKPMPNELNLSLNDSLFKNGEITLIFDVENIFADKQGKKTNIQHNISIDKKLDLDIPKPSFDFSKKSFSELKENLETIEEKISENIKFKYQDSILKKLFDTIPTNHNDLKEDLHQSATNKIYFLSINEIEFNIPLKNKELPELANTEPLASYIRSGRLKNPFSIDFSTSDFSLIWKNTISNYLEKIVFENNKEKYFEFYNELLYLNEGEINRSHVEKYYLAQKNIINDEKEVDYKKLNKELDSKISKFSDDYNQFVNDQMSKVFINLHLCSDNKKNEEYSIENISRWMLNRYSNLNVSNLKKSNLFDSLDELVDYENLEHFSSEAFLKKMEIFKFLIREHEVFEKNELTTNVKEELIKEKIQIVIEKIGYNSNVSISEIKRFLTMNGFNSNLSKEKLHILKNNSIFINNSPVEHFIAKPFLPFYYKKEPYMENHEVIKGIVAPKNISKDLKEYFKENKITVYYYNKDDLNQRYNCLLKMKKFFMK